MTRLEDAPDGRRWRIDLAGRWRLTDPGSLQMLFAMSVECPDEEHLR